VYKEELSEVPYYLVIKIKVGNDLHHNRFAGLRIHYSYK